MTKRKTNAINNIAEKFWRSIATKNVRIIIDACEKLSCRHSGARRFGDLAALISDETYSKVPTQIHYSRKTK